MWKKKFIVTFHGEEGIFKTTLVVKLNEGNKYISLFSCSFMFTGIDVGGVSRVFYLLM